MQDPQIEELITLLFSTSRLVRESMKPTNTTDSFTPLRMGTLRYIAESKNPTMQEVAKFLSITAPSATSLIDGLIQAGVISRNSSTSDRRIVHLEITAKGSQTLEKARKAMVVGMREVITHLDVTDIADFLRIMQKLHKTYKE